MVLLPGTPGMAQQKNEQVKTALLIIDIQNFYFPGEGPGLAHAEEAGIAAKEILRIFREKQQTVIHVRHKSSKGFEIHPNVAPVAGEKVITKEEVNCFQKTDLLEHLQNQGITRLILIGMQTHMCLEAAARAAHDFGFECLVVQEACATRDLKFDGKVAKAEDVQTAALATITNGGYAKVIDIDTFKKFLDKFLFLK